MRRFPYFIPRLLVYSIFFGVFLLDSGVLKGFGPRGPYDHATINHRAFKEFTERTGFEIRLDCAEHLNQSNLQADTQYPMHAEYHCDNSEFYRCSALLENLTSGSLRDVNYLTSIRKIGMATHIIQDFYSHSNWVEITRMSYAVAPLENLKDFYLLVPNLQSGWHPFSPEGTPEEMSDCFLRPEEEWGNRIFGATHGCMEKDSNLSIRGGTIATGPLAFGRTYHELAGELAITHTANYLESLYKKNHPILMSCLVPKTFGSGIGCNNYLGGALRRL